MTNLNFEPRAHRPEQSQNNHRTNKNSNEIGDVTRHGVTTARRVKKPLGSRV